MGPSGLEGPEGEKCIFEASAAVDAEAIVNDGLAFDASFKRSFLDRSVDMGEHRANEEKLWRGITGAR